MKKLFATLCLMATASGVFAQGWINWATPANAITAETNASGSPLFGGTGGGFGGATAPASSGVVFNYELLYQPWTGSLTTDTAVWDGTWLDSGLAATNSNTAGRLVPVNSGNRTVPWANGTTMNIVLVGWSSGLGTTWNTVSSLLFDLYTDPATLTSTGFFGESDFGYINPSLAQPGAVVFATGATGSGLPIYSLDMQLYVLPIPEPATFALAGLGGLVLLMFRRRK